MAEIGAEAAGGRDADSDHRNVAAWREGTAEGNHAAGCVGGWVDVAVAGERIAGAAVGTAGEVPAEREQERPGGRLGLPVEARMAVGMPPPEAGTDCIGVAAGEVVEVGVGRQGEEAGSVVGADVGAGAAELVAGVAVVAASSRRSHNSRRVALDQRDEPLLRRRSAEQVVTRSIAHHTRQLRWLAERRRRQPSTQNSPVELAEAAEDREGEEAAEECTQRR